MVSACDFLERDQNKIADYDMNLTYKQIVETGYKILKIIKGMRANIWWIDKFGLLAEESTSR